MIKELEKARWRHKIIPERNIAAEYFEYFMNHEVQITNKVEKEFEVKRRPFVLYRQTGSDDKIHGPIRWRSYETLSL